MHRVTRLFGFFLFWIMFGLLLAAGLLYYRGDLSLDFDRTGPVAQAEKPEPRPREPVVFSLQQTSFADAVAIASPAVVTIRAISVVEAQVPEGIKLLERFLGRSPQTQPRTRMESTSGSGVIMDSEGYILTNHHVIADADKLAVLLNDGRTALADVVGTDPETDLAVIRIEMKKLPSIKRSSISDVRIGDIVLAIGNPFEIGQTVTQGIISATGRKSIGGSAYQNYLQTDAAINPGNSGGALINTDGELIGINSLIYSRTGDYQGISFAIPVDMATHVLSQIKKNGFVVRGWLGAEGVEVNRAILQKLGLDDVQGVLIMTVEPDGPASKADIQTGDIITHIDDKPITAINDIMQMVADGKPGDTLKIEGLRMRESIATEVTLGQRPLQSQ